MAEGKKRVRPTVAQVKVLEDCIAGFKEVIQKKDELIASLKSEVTTLTLSNRSMEDELKRKVGREDDTLKKWKEKAIKCETEVMRLRSRGFLARLFNR